MMSEQTAEAPAATDRLGVLGKIKNVVTFTLNRCPKCGFPAVVFDCYERPEEEEAAEGDVAAHCTHCGWSSPTPPSSFLASSLSFWLGIAASVLVTVLCIIGIEDSALRAMLTVYITSALAIFMAFLPTVLPYPLNKEDPFSVVTCIIEGLFVLSIVSLMIFALFGALPVPVKG